MTAKLVRVPERYYPRDDFGHWCPACQTGHEIAVSKKNASNASWSFDGNLRAPTFTPSINLRINTPDMQGYNPRAGTTICHYFITAGRIIYQGDCTHALRGQTVDLPDVPDHVYISGERLHY